ncbi:hypothetical protein A5844_000538 [Enterococcus sp. 10A9_DIV0425]|uniref:Uncharacterized protein n=1 Tax=Candidatus Enterococcus wittei TaxID=1987383 RepID=A0A2C9XSB5_9ENTE|nr:hypothetical protein A5844_000538 [Enterococcus sp. 10A9_DIV0425]
MINYLVFIYLIFDQLYVILASILRLDSTSTQDLSAYVYLKVFLAVFSSGIIIMKILLDKKISLKTLYSLLSLIHI